MLIPSWPAHSSVKSLVICKNDELSDYYKLLPAKTVWLNQVHGSDVYQVSDLDNYNKSKVLIEQHANNNLSEHYKKKLVSADASYTTNRGVACVIKTADCLPIFITNIQGDWVAAIHAGWRSLAGGIIENAIKKYNSCSDNIHNSSELMVWLGPAICSEHFIVGDEVKDIFTNINSADKVAFTKVNNISTKWHADLYKLAIGRFQQWGVSNITSCNSCTYCNPELFHSYRRDQGKYHNTGRLLSLIWLE